jgi:hypothetical protein
VRVDCGTNAGQLPGGYGHGSSNRLKSKLENCIATDKERNVSQVVLFKFGSGPAIIEFLDNLIACRELFDHGSMHMHTIDLHTLLAQVKRCKNPSTRVAAVWRNPDSVPGLLPNESSLGKCVLYDDRTEATWPLYPAAKILWSRAVFEAPHFEEPGPAWSVEDRAIGFGW